MQFNQLTDRKQFIEENSHQTSRLQSDERWDEILALRKYSYMRSIQVDVPSSIFL
jgi:hypothetical protein